MYSALKYRLPNFLKRVGGKNISIKFQQVLFCKMHDTPTCYYATLTKKCTKDRLLK